MAASSSNFHHSEEDFGWPRRTPPDIAPVRDTLPQRIADAWGSIIVRHMLPLNEDAGFILGRDGLPSAHFDAYGGMFPTFVQSLGLPTNRLRMRSPITTEEASLCMDTSYAPWLYMTNSTHAYEATNLRPVRTFVAFNFTHGYCYLSLFVPLSFSIETSNIEAFSRFIEQLPDVLGAYPTLGTLLKVMLYLVRVFPEILDSPIPIISKRPGVAQFHVSDRRGLPPSWFTMMCGSVASFITLLLHNLDNALLDGVVGSYESVYFYTTWITAHDHWATSRFITLGDFYDCMSAAHRVDCSTVGGCSALHDLLADLGFINLVRRAKRFPMRANGIQGYYLNLSDDGIHNNLQAFLQILREISDGTNSNPDFADVRMRLNSMDSIPYNNPHACYTRNIFEDSNNLVWNYEFFRISAISQNAKADRERLERFTSASFREFVKEASNNTYIAPMAVSESVPNQPTIEHEEPNVIAPPRNAWLQISIGIATAILGAIIFFFWKCFLRAKKIRFRGSDAFPWFHITHGGGPPFPPDIPPPGSPYSSPSRTLPRTVVRDLSFNEDDDLLSVDLNEAGTRFSDIISMINRGDLRELQVAIPEHLSNLNLLQNSAHGSGFYTMVALYLATLNDAIVAYQERNDVSGATIQSLRTLELQLESRGILFNVAGTPTNFLHRNINASVGGAVVRITQSALLASGENFRTRMAATLDRVSSESSENRTPYDNRVFEMTTELFKAIAAALDADRNDVTPHLANAEALLQVYNNLFGTDYVSTSLLALRRELIIRSAEGRIGEAPVSSPTAADDELVKLSITKLDKEIELFQAQIDGQRRVAAITEASNLRENILQPINTVANIAMAGAFLRGGARSRLPGSPATTVPPPGAPFRPFTGRGHSLTSTSRSARFFGRSGA
ncbi:polyprotein [Wheat spindle streak mosaic virus]|nr:polyprotein [Wheat spindle streak mosaic virus]